MNRYRLEIEFDGTDYVGWQRQPNGPTIQATLEEAVQEMLAERAVPTAAGRTDSGVHAMAMTCHLDLARLIDPERLRAGLNHFLQTKRIAVLRVRAVSDDFHARFSAISRCYRYRILNRRAQPTLTSGQCWHVAQALDAKLMHEAGQILVGHHDFTSFRASECQAKSPIKTVNSLQIDRHGEEILMDIEAPSFLHHQVRNIIGTLKLVGNGARPTSFIQEALQARHRSAAGPTAPPQGLYFVQARYQTDAEGRS